MRKRRADTGLPRRVTAFAAGKINVAWRVGALRGDGFHDVCGIIHTISLHDRLDVSAGESADQGLVVDVGAPFALDVVGAAKLATEDNLVVRAARALAGTAVARPTSIRLEKSIPVAAGLGGGSADAAAALVALNVVWGAGLAPARLLELGAEVGSDVPAILAGGLVHVGGRGERVRRIGGATAGAFVLGISAERIPAADAYARWDAMDPPDANDSMSHNDLEAAAAAILPELGDRVAAMRAAGTDPVFVSGSGPTVVGVAADDRRAREAAERVGGSFARVEVVHPSPWGVRLVMGDR